VWCPECGAEYLPGFERCVACDVRLIDSPVSIEPDVTVSSDAGEISADMPGSSHDPSREWLKHPREIRARHREERYQLAEEALTHQVAAEHSVADADFTSFKAFYKANEARRGDDVALRRFTDGEVVWSVCWLPRTSEVAAFSVAWSDARWHTSTSVSEGYDGIHAGLSTERVPELVVVLGRAPSSDNAGALVGAAPDLRSMRAALQSVPVPDPKMSYVIVTRRSCLRDDLRYYKVFVDGGERDRIKPTQSAIVGVTAGTHVLQVKLDRWFTSRKVSFVSQDGADCSFECGSWGPVWRPHDYIGLRRRTESSTRAEEQPQSEPSRAARVLTSLQVLASLALMLIILGVGAVRLASDIAHRPKLVRPSALAIVGDGTTGETCTEWRYVLADAQKRALAGDFLTGLRSFTPSSPPSGRQISAMVTAVNTACTSEPETTSVDEAMTLEYASKLTFYGP
jgi:hypothetical protein